MKYEAIRPYFASHKPSMAGYTIMELMVVVAIMISMVSLTMPHFFAMRSATHRANGAAQFEGDLKAIGTRAIAEGARGVISIVGGGASYTMGLDRVPYSNAGTADSILWRGNLPEGVTISSSVAIIFDSRGFLITPAGLLTTSTVTLSYNGTQYSTSTISSISGS